MTTPRTVSSAMSNRSSLARNPKPDRLIDNRESHAQSRRVTMPNHHDQSCAATAKLEQLLNEQLGVSEEAELLRHVDGCPACQRAMELVAAGNDMWNDLPAHLSGRIRV